MAGFFVCSHNYLNHISPVCVVCVCVDRAIASHRIAKPLAAGFSHPGNALV